MKVPCESAVEASILAACLVLLFLWPDACACARSMLP